MQTNVHLLFSEISHSSQIFTDFPKVFDRKNGKLLKNCQKTSISIMNINNLSIHFYEENTRFRLTIEEKRILSSRGNTLFPDPSLFDNLDEKSF